MCQSFPYLILGSLLLLVTIFAFFVPSHALAEYTSIFTSSTFDGVKADVTMGATAWIGVIAAVAGAGIIIKVLFFR